MIICNIKKKFKFILFADDTNIYSNSDIADLVRLTNIELEKLCVCMVCSKQAFSQYIKDKLLV